MKTPNQAIVGTLVVGACFAPAAWAFTSGSTGADGAFNPTVNTTVVLPPSGTFNYTSVSIPVGVTVTYLRNAGNTPVAILATGDVVIAGTLSVSGNSGVSAGTAGDGNPGDDGVPGTGGPGGFDGGRGGVVTSVVPATNNAVRGGAGLGPGGGGGADLTGLCNGAPSVVGGAGAGYSTPGTSTSGCGVPTVTGVGGAAYGSPSLIPLIGGSGGGGGDGGITFNGAGGGGGGGAILIAATGTINITGSLLAVGGNGGAQLGNGQGGAGGGASGGAIRLVATTITGNGTVSAGGGAAGTSGGSGNVCCFISAAAAGAPGRVRIEAESYTRTAGTTPAFSFAAPGPLFAVGSPTLSIASVGGVLAPATPTGGIDVALPSSTPNPVTVVFATSGVPVGGAVQLRVTPANGAVVTATSSPLTGSTTSATASASVSLPAGPSVMQAQTTFTVIAAIGDLLRNFAGNERVERITLSATLGGESRARLITVSGKEFDAPAEALRIAGFAG
jgi:hypothetical protein